MAFASEDLSRAGFYQDNAKRASLQKQVGGVDAYLESLDMTITFQPFDATGRARIVQLINKSNQYNLTTRRYTDPEVTEAENDPAVFTLQVRLADIFGDNGMISVVICRPGKAGVWEIDTWLMSCRVLGRKVEHMVLRAILEHARVAGINKLIGTYQPTDRNKLVVDHYAKLGFTKVEEEESGLAQSSPEWRSYVEQFDRDATEIEGQAKAAGVPLVTVLVPNRVQAAMISMGEWPSGYDPYKLDDQLRSIITAHGGTYIDILPWLAATVVLAFWEWLRAALLSIRTSDGPVLASRYARVAYATALGLAAFVMTVLLSQPAPDVVYKAF